MGLILRTGSKYAGRSSFQKAYFFVLAHSKQTFSFFAHRSARYPERIREATSEAAIFELCWQPGRVYVTS